MYKLKKLGSVKRKKVARKKVARKKVARKKVVRKKVVRKKAAQKKAKVKKVYISGINKFSADLINQRMEKFHKVQREINFVNQLIEKGNYLKQLEKTPQAKKNISAAIKNMKKELQEMKIHSRELKKLL